MLCIQGNRSSARNLQVFEPETFLGLHQPDLLSRLQRNGPSSSFPGPPHGLGRLYLGCSILTHGKQGTAGALEDIG